MTSRVTFQLRSRTVVARNPDGTIELWRGEVSEKTASTGRHYHVEDRHLGPVMRTEEVFERFMTEIDNIFVADQAIPIGDDCEWVAVEPGIEGHDRTIPFRASGTVANVDVRLG